MFVCVCVCICLWFCTFMYLVSLMKFVLQNVTSQNFAVSYFRFLFMQNLMQFLYNENEIWPENTLYDGQRILKKDFKSSRGYIKNVLLFL